MAYHCLLSKFTTIRVLDMYYWSISRPLKKILDIGPDTRLLLDAEQYN